MASMEIFMLLPYNNSIKQPNPNRMSVLWRIIVLGAVTLCLAACVVEPYPEPGAFAAPPPPPVAYYAPGYYAQPYAYGPYAYPEYPPYYAYDARIGVGFGRGGGWHRHWR